MTGITFIDWELNIGQLNDRITQQQPCGKDLAAERLTLHAVQHSQGVETLVMLVGAPVSAGYNWYKSQTVVKTARELHEMLRGLFEPASDRFPKS